MRCCKVSVVGWWEGGGGKQYAQLWCAHEHLCSCQCKDSRTDHPIATPFPQ